jgi:hypothetical protein
MLGSRRGGVEGERGDADGWATPALWLETVTEGSELFSICLSIAGTQCGSIAGSELFSIRLSIAGTEPCSIGIAVAGA